MIVWKTDSKINTLADAVSLITVRNISRTEDENQMVNSILKSCSNAIITVKEN